MTEPWQQDLDSLRQQLGGERVDQERAELVKSLRAYRRTLVQEAHRIDRMLDELGASRRPRPKPAERRSANGLYTLLRRYVAEAVGPDEEITWTLAMEWMLANGWETTAQDKGTSVASALAHLARWEEIEWVGRGKYRKYPNGEATGG
jgi:hypothetical protein